MIVSGLEHNMHISVVCPNIGRHHCWSCGDTHIVAGYGERGRLAGRAWRTFGAG